jgi:tRNA threonylcarbamoyladenosine biosynthesis protein TsaB
MTTLAFDTATRATTVALCDLAHREDLEARDDPPEGARPRHATHLMPLAVGLMQRAEVGWDELDRLAVGVGPGTFTGLRIGIATARALARAREIPLVGISTLQSLALGGAQAGAPAAEAVLAVIDARRGEVFVGGWRPGPVSEGDTPLLRPRVLAPDTLPALVEELALPILALGDGALAFRTVLERSGASVPDDDSELHRVSAINHCKLARRLSAEPPEQVGPRYMRLPDAEIARQAAHRQ